MSVVLPGVVQGPTNSMHGGLAVLPKARSQTDIFRNKCSTTSKT